MLQYPGCCDKFQKYDDADNILFCGRLLGLQVHA